MVDGLVVIDKPSGCTSHDVVARCRRIFGQRRVGHAGTLDPAATGVLLVGLGRATRLLRFLSVLPKTYEGEIVLGTETSTLDSEGEVTATHDMAEPAPDEVKEAAARLTGTIEQLPPMVSAVKVGGRRLHELARRREEVDRTPRTVVVHRFDFEPTPDPLVFRTVVECSAGTYVRALAADLGHALGGGAHLRGLRRTAVGGFTLIDARPLDAVTVDSILPMASAVAHLPRTTVAGAADLEALAHGRLPGGCSLAGEGPWALVDEAGVLLAVCERRGDVVRPAVVVTDSR